MSQFLREYERSMANFTDAPAVYHTASAYAIFGALLTRHKYRCRLQGGMPARWTNLWVILEGETGGPRKTTAINMAQDILRKVDNAIAGPSDGSPEGFMEHLHTMERAVPGNATTILLVEEFATMLQNLQKSYAHALKGILMKLYDVPPEHTVALVKKQYTVPLPRVSMLGGVATELLPNMTESIDWLGGFMNRAIIVHGERSRTMKRGSTPPDKVMRKHADQLFYCLRAWRNSQVRAKRPLLDYDKKALKLATSLPDLPTEQVLRSSLTRVDVHLMKVAAVEQIDEDPESLEIKRPAVERAMKLIDYWWKTVPEVIDSCYARGREDFEGDRLSKRIMRYLKGCGGEARWPEVMKNCALSQDHMWKAVQSLIDAELAVIEEKGEVDPLQPKSKSNTIIKVLAKST